MRKKVKASQKEEIKQSEHCPCDSGKIYKNCCSKKDFKWVRDKKGNIYRGVGLSKELVTELKAQQQKFEDMMGRKIGKGDLVFFQQFFYSDSDLEKGTIEALRKAGVPEQFVYAYKKTGLIITEDNRKRVPDADLKIYGDAIDEYFEKVDSGQPIDDLDVLLHKDKNFRESMAMWSSLCDQTEAVILNYSLFLHKPPRVRSDVLFYQYFLIARTLRTFQTVLSLLDQGRGDDGLTLIRSMYENYLHFIYIGKYPEKVQDLVFAKLGLESGTHEYERTAKGKYNPQVIIEKKSGRKFDGHISNRKMAHAGFLEDVELYDMMYEYMSGYAHPNINNVFQYLDDEKGFTYLKEVDSFNSLRYAMLVNALLFDEMRLMPHTNATKRKDLLRISSRIRDTFLKLAEIAERAGMPASDMSDILLKRIKLVGKRQ